MMFYLKLFCIAFIVFAPLEIVWLGYLAQSFYKKHLGYLLAESVNVPAAILFYVIFLAGLVVFCIAPAMHQGVGWRAWALGAFFGLVAFGTYDLTSQALIKDWPVIVTIVDMVWGTALTATVCGLSYAIARWLQVS